MMHSNITYEKAELIALFKVSENLYRPQFIINGILIEAISTVTTENLNTCFFLFLDDIKKLEA